MVAGVSKPVAHAALRCGVVDTSAASGNLGEFVIHPAAHKSHRIRWLRAAVLGANDGIVSTASLIIGVAAAHATHASIILAGVAGLVAGAMSMAAGEYVSVSSQADTEKADLEIERISLKENIEFEKDELADIYKKRGLDTDLSKQVAKQLMAHDSLGAHARDELGISDNVRAQPIQAAFSSAATFIVGATLPLLTAWLVPVALLIPIVAGLTLIFLAVLGGLAARAGGASIVIGAARVTFWGTLAMGITAAVGRVLGIIG
jgi:VIT1/CCC1 family predicted Fe2+/Mn2+ transporter